MGANSSEALSLKLAGEGCESAIDHISRAFGEFDGKTIKSPKFPWSADFTSSGELILLSTRYHGSWEFWPLSETPEKLMISRINQGMLDARWGTKVVECDSGSIMLNNNVEVDRSRFRGEINQTDSLFIDWSMIAKTTAGIFDRPLTGSLLLAPQLDAETPSGRTIMRLIDTITEGMRPQGPLLSSPLGIGQLTEALASLILLNVPNRFTQYLNREPASLAPRQVKQAIDFMHDNIGRPITIQSVAHAIGISSRSLEIAFRSFKDTTPAVYLQTIRLEAVRAELSDPTSAHSVSETALRWGFFHRGRFAEIYRKAYGEMPSETRARYPRR